MFLSKAVGVVYLLYCFCLFERYEGSNVPLMSDLKDFQFSASSFQDGYHPQKAQLKPEDSGWCASLHDKDPFLRIEFLAPVTVSQLQVQGWRELQWMILQGPDIFYIKSGNTTNSLIDYSVNEQRKEFHVDPSNDMTEVQTFILEDAFTATFISFHPLLSRTENHCMKVGAVGHRTEEVVIDHWCKDDTVPLGLFPLQQALVSLSAMHIERMHFNSSSCKLACASDSCVAVLYNTLESTCTVYGKFRNDIPLVLQEREGTELVGKVCVEEGNNGSNALITRTLVEDAPYLMFSPEYPLMNDKDSVTITWSIDYFDYNHNASDKYPIILFEEILFENPESCAGYIQIVDISVKLWNDSYYLDRKMNNIDVKLWSESYYIDRKMNKKQPFMVIQKLSADITFRPCASGNKFRALVSKTDIPVYRENRFEDKTYILHKEQLIYSNLIRGFPTGAVESYHIVVGRAKLVSVRYFHVGCETGSSFKLYENGELSNARTYCNLNRPPKTMYFPVTSLYITIDFYGVDTNTICPNGFILHHSDIVPQHLPRCRNDTCLYVSDVLCPKEEAGSIQSREELNIVWSIFADDTDSNTDDVIHIGSIIPPTKGAKLVYHWSDGTPVTFTAWSSDTPKIPVQTPALPLQEVCVHIHYIGDQSVENPWKLSSCDVPSNKYLCKSKITRSVANIRETIQRPNRNGPIFKDSAYFNCGTGELVSYLVVCDKKPDCEDGSDEICTGPRGFVTQSQVENRTDFESNSDCMGRFTCTSGECLPYSVYCDFIQDCQDGSDEIFCNFTSCNDDEFQCNNSQCILKTFRCDGSRQCKDRSDEENCLGQCKGTNSFDCGDGTCIVSERVCDGFVDCPSVVPTDEDACVPESMYSCLEWWIKGHRKTQMYKIRLFEICQSSYCIDEVECDFDRTLTENVIVERYHNIDFAASDTCKEYSHCLKYRQEQFVGRRFIADNQIFIQTCPSNRKRLAEHFNLAYHPEYWDCLCIQYTRFGMNNSVWYTPCSNATKKLVTDGIINLKERWTHDVVFKHGFIPALGLNLSVTQQTKPVGSNMRTVVYPGVLERVEDYKVNVHVLHGTINCVRGNPVSALYRCLNDIDESGHVIGCRDLTHLQGCETFQCPSDFVKCPNSFCIPIRLLCDGTMDCLHGEDENGCHNLQSVNESPSCSGLYRCNGTKVCIPRHQLCDNILHCAGGDDERLCGFQCLSQCNCTGYEILCRNLHGITNLALELSEVSPLTKYLDVSANSLTEIPSMHLPYLALLNVSNNHISVINPSRFVSMINLLTLDLRHNRLYKLEPDIFHGLGKLTTLKLKGNKELSAISPGAFLGLVALGQLRIAGTKVQKLVENTFVGLDSLERLDVSKNVLLSVENGAFRGLNFVKYLDISGNRISVFKDNIFDGLTKLGELKTDAYQFCCVKPSSVPKEKCFPREDEFSSCSDLMRYETPRILLWIIGLCALIGNCLSLLYRFWFDRNRLKIGYGIFVTNLAIADFLMGVYLIIIASADSYYRGIYIWNDEAWRNSRWCTVAGVLSSVSSEASVLFICLITIDRILVIKYPFGHLKFSTKPATRISVIGWLLTFVVFIMPVVHTDYFQGEYYSRSAVCLALPLTRKKPSGWFYSLSIFVVFNFLTFLLIALGQVLIYREIQSSKRSIKNSRKRQSDIAIARNLLLVVATDFLCWFPVGVMGIMALNGYPISGDVYVWTCVFILPINSALNPFLYTFSAILKKKNFAPNVDEQESTIDLKDWRNVMKIGSFLGRLPINYIDLDAFVENRSSIELSESLHIVWTIVWRLGCLHHLGLLYDNLSGDKIGILEQNRKIKDIWICLYLKKASKDNHHSVDMYQVGLLSRKLLMAWRKRSRVGQKIEEPQPSLML